MNIFNFITPQELNAFTAFFISFLAVIGAMFCCFLLYDACERIARKSHKWWFKFRVAFSRFCKRSARIKARAESEQVTTENGHRMAGGLNYGK